MKKFIKRLLFWIIALTAFLAFVSYPRPVIDDDFNILDDPFFDTPPKYLEKGGLQESYFLSKSESDEIDRILRKYYENEKEPRDKAKIIDLCIAFSKVFPDLGFYYFYDNFDFFLSFATFGPPYTDSFKWHVSNIIECTLKNMKYNLRYLYYKFVEPLEFEKFKEKNWRYVYRTDLYRT